MNVLFFHVIVEDCLPVVAYISLENIKAGDELLCDYGPEYWNRIDKVILPTKNKVKDRMFYVYNIYLEIKRIRQNNKLS